MQGHPLLDKWMRDAPELVILGVFMLQVVLNQPKPKPGSVLHRWWFDSSMAFARIVQRILPNFLGGGRK